MSPIYQFVADDALVPGWAFFFMDGEPICFTLDDWSDDPELIGPEVGVIHVHPEDLDEMLSFIGGTVH